MFNSPNQKEELTYNTTQNKDNNDSSSIIILLLLRSMIMKTPKPRTHRVTHQHTARSPTLNFTARQCFAMEPNISPETSYDDNDHYDEHAIKLRKQAKCRSTVKKLCSLIFVSFGAIILFIAIREKIATPDVNDESMRALQGTLVSFLNTVVFFFPFKLIALFLHYALQRIDDQFAEEILQMAEKSQGELRFR